MIILILALSWPYQVVTRVASLWNGGAWQNLCRLGEGFTMANIALPGTSSFVGEFLILVGAFQANTMVTMLAATGMVLGGAYSLWLYNRVAFGNLKVQSIHEFSDINRREFFVQLPLILGTLLMGIYPEIFLDPMHVSIANLVEQINLGISK